MNRYFWIALAIAIPAVGYGIMHGLVYVVPMDSDTGGAHILFTIVLIMLGLSVPYYMLKAGIHAAHKRDPREKELDIKDVPKYKDELGDRNS